MRIVLRVPGGRSPLSLFVAGSVAVHVILAVVFVLAPFGKRRASAASDSMVVELAGPIGSSAPGGSSAPPASRAEPAPPEVPKPQGPSVVEPPKEPKEKKKQEKKEEKKTEPKPPSPTAPTPPAPGPPGPPGPPGGSGPGGGGIIGGSGSGAGDPGSSEIAWYWASVTAALRSHWVRPVLEGASGVLTVTITFDVRRDGTVANANVETGSGVPSLDRSALRAVADASPLPPLPASIRDGSLSARYQFELTPGGEW